MVESTARREKPDAGNSLSYLWQVAGKPVAVSLALDLIDRLEREVVENFRSLTSRGSEIGGLLLGYAAPGADASTVVSVVDYETIACDYSRGPLFRLADPDHARFARAIEQHRGGAGAGVIGFFRAHTRKGISLDADDLAFLSAHFNRPHEIALLVRPFATKTSVGGIFLWEDGRIQADASALEFPFRSIQLSESGKIQETPRVAAPLPTPAAPTPPPSKPTARAQIVPIATRREFAVPSVSPVPEPAAAAPPPSTKPEPQAKLEPAASPPIAAPLAVSPAEGVKTQTTRISLGRAAETKPAPDLKSPLKSPSAESKATELSEKTAEREKAPAKPPEAEPAAKPAPPPRSQSFLNADTTEPARSHKLVFIVLSAAAAVVLAVALFVYPGFLTQSRRPSVPQSASTQILRVERTGTDLLLTWNRDSEAIRNATRAVLTINDGDRQENYNMDPAQLSSGSIVYSPISGDVSFRMELTGRDQTKTTTESVRVLRTRPSPMADTAAPAPQKPDAAPAAPAAPIGAAAGTPVVPPAGQSGASPMDPSVPSEQPAAVVAPAKKFDASSLATRLRPARETDVPEAAAIDAPSAGLPGANSSGAAPTPFAASSAPPRPLPPPSAPAAAALSSPGGQIREATVVYKKAPDYPVMARQMGAKGEVVLSATVGTDGRVKSVKVLKGHPLLVKAASEAVMQWIYRPTLLNGQPVQNDVRITLNFDGQ